MGGEGLDGRGRDTSAQNGRDTGAENAPGSAEDAPGSGENAPGTAETHQGGVGTAPGSWESAAGSVWTAAGTAENTPGGAESAAGTAEDAPGGAGSAGGAGERAADRPAGRDARRARVRELTASERYAGLRAGLVAKLEAPGALELEQVEEYMDLWVKRQLLSEAIDRRGVNVTIHNGSQKFTKTNDDLDVMLRVGLAMDRILAELGLKRSAGPEAAPDLFGDWAI